MQFMEKSYFDLIQRVYDLQHFLFFPWKQHTVIYQEYGKFSVKKKKGCKECVGLSNCMPAFAEPKEFCESSRHLL